MVFQILITTALMKSSSQYHLDSSLYSTKELKN